MEVVAVKAGVSTADISSEITLCECIICKILVKGFSSFSFEEKKNVISIGRPTPLLKLSKNTKKFVRHFHVQNYKSCEWLTGCDTKSVLFCWPCLLFSNEKGLWNKNGFSDLNNLHKLIKRHALSKAHVQAIVKEKTFGNTRIEHTLDNQLKISHEQHNKEVKKNRNILKRLIDVVCFLGEHELGFRGHDESESSINKGNYVDLINLLAKYDETLNVHLATSKVFKGTSNLIQNDLITSVGEVVLKNIKSEIEEASFVAIVLDETTDVSNICQLSKVLRYVTKKGDVKERFLGFSNVSTQRTAASLYNVVKCIVEEFNCGTKLIAQSYDGAAVMSGELGGLQAKVKETYPSALFVHCMAHRLNLVLQQSASNIKECKIFFSTLSGLATFFSKSSKRTSALDSEIHKRMPRVAPTRWNYNGRLVQTVYEYRQLLINFFEKVLDKQETWDQETVVGARAYVNLLNADTNFNFLLIIFSEIFPFCDSVFAILQNKTNDINFCIKKIKEFESTVLSKREQFDVMWNKVEQLNLDVEAGRRKRTRTDMVLVDEETRYRKLFFEIIDNISTHTDVRFQNLESLKFLELIDFSEHRTIPESAFDSLKKNYSGFFDLPALRSQLSVIYNTSEGLNKNSVSDVWKSIKSCGLGTACQEIIKLCELTLTIPATSASTERSFSVLKRIKNFVRNSTGQDRLTNLALLSIEKGFVQEISEEETFYDDVINRFAERSRRIPLTFK